jgi:hypothetical protein
MTNQQPGGKIYLPPLDTTASWDVWLFGTRSENYLDCVNNANGNQQEIRTCVDRYLTNP